MSRESDLDVTCSDEEIDKAFEEDSNGDCYPVSAEAVMAACNRVMGLKAGGAVLEWQCPYGRRPLTPEAASPMSTSEEQQISASLVDTSGFDFSDDSASVRLQTPRRLHHSTATPKGSAKKKTTSFENILASVRRQKNMEAKEKHNRFKK